MTKKSFEKVGGLAKKSFEKVDGLVKKSLEKNKGMCDFVFRYKGKCTLLEVKANTGNVKSAKTILNHPEKYHVYDAIKLGDYNVANSGQIITLPLYMAFLLREV